MLGRKESPVEIAAQAVRSAEDRLAHLPLSPEVMDLQRRVLAVKTVLLGIARIAPRLSVAQRERLAKDAVALARRVRELQRGDARDSSLAE